jgi:hypothetical protein
VPLQPIAWALALVAGVAAHGWVALRHGRGPLMPAVVAALALPWVIPPAWLWPRTVAVVLSVTLSVKCLEMARGRADDPRMLERVGTFLFWLIIPPDSTPASDERERARARARGGLRMARGALKGAIVWGLLALEAALPQLHDDPWVEATWAMWLTYLALSGTTDLAGGLAMQTGIDVRESFDAPYLARSPREFWGRRWNVYVHRVALRNLFRPLRGTRRPVVATTVVFAASALMHEYFVFAALGRFGAHTGWMTAFFALQALAVLGQLALERRRSRRAGKLPAPLAIGMHLAWLTLTAPLFFAPLGELFAGR